MSRRTVGGLLPYSSSSLFVMLAVNCPLFGSTDTDPLQLEVFTLPGGPKPTAVNTFEIELVSVRYFVWSGVG